MFWLVNSRCKRGPSVPRCSAPFLLRQVRYPLELSLLFGSRAITAIEEAPLVVVLRNVSTRPAYAASISLVASAPLGGSIMWRPILDAAAVQAVQGADAAGAAAAAAHTLGPTGGP